MRVLVLEDRDEIMEMFTDFLEDCDHEVSPCFDIYEADERLGEQKQGFDCYLIDLAMSSDGLGDEYIADTRRGYFTGWVWLRSRILDKDPNLARRCILLSGFKDSFEENYLRTDEKSRTLLFEALLLSKNDSKWREELGKRLKTIEERA